MRAVAGAEPAPKVARIGERDAAEVSAHADDDKPLGILHPLCIRLWIPKGLQVDGVRELDVFLGAAADEDGLAPPLDGDGGPGLDVGEVDFEGGKGEHILGGGHAQDELEDEEAEEGGVDEAATGEDEVGKGPLAGITGRVPLVVVLVVGDFGTRILHSCHSCGEVG